MMFFMSEEDADKHRAAHDVVAHDISRLFDELPEEHLRSIVNLLDGISNATDPTKIAGYLAGRGTQTLQYRFNICAACNRNHDTELLQPTEDKVPDDQPEVTFTEKGSTAPLGVDETVLMQQYRLDDVRDADTHALLWFVCVGCGMQYQSIEDRMLREPGIEGCSGCIQKEKWG